MTEVPPPPPAAPTGLCTLWPLVALTLASWVPILWIVGLLTGWW